jgi:HTH-type transcriptional regulator / antitoxin HipB
MSTALQTPGQLAPHLRALRLAKGWSQATLGQRMGLSQTRIARMEADPLAISTGQLLALLTVLGVQVSLQPVRGDAKHDAKHDLKRDAKASSQADW